MTLSRSSAGALATHVLPTRTASSFGCVVATRVTTSSACAGRPRVSLNPILGESFGFDKVAGVLMFRMKEQPLTLFRLSYDPKEGFAAAIAHGQVENNPAETFGAYGWTRIKGLIPFYRDVILRHFPHHTGFTAGHIGPVLWEAFGNYLETDVYTPQTTPTGEWHPTPPGAIAG